MQKRLLLVRHGNTFESSEKPRFVGSRSDLDLTSFGLEQARRVGMFCKNAHFEPDCFMSGTLKRHIQFMQEIIKTLNLGEAKPERLGSLKEIDYGQWEGLTEEEIESAWPEEFKNWSEKGVWPSGIFSGTEDQFSRDIESWLSDCYSSPVQNILAVTSNGVLRYVHRIINNQKTYQYSKNCKVGTGKISLLLAEKGRFQIKLWNHDPLQLVTII